MPDDALRYAAVAVLAASPVGELLVAIPVGMGLGLAPLPVAVVAAAANLAPALALDLVLERVLVLARRRPAMARLLGWLSRPALARLLERWGAAVVVVATPWAGVYATVVTLRLLGVRRGPMLVGIGASLALYATAVTLLSHLGFSLARR